MNEMVYGEKDADVIEFNEKAILSRPGIIKKIAKEKTWYLFLMKTKDRNRFPTIDNWKGGGYSLPLNWKPFKTLLLDDHFNNRKTLETIYPMCWYFIYPRTKETVLNESCIVCTRRFDKIKKINYWYFYVVDTMNFKKVEKLAVLVSNKPYMLRKTSFRRFVGSKIKNEVQRTIMRKKQQYFIHNIK